MVWSVWARMVFRPTRGSQRVEIEEVGCVTRIVREQRELARILNAFSMVLSINRVAVSGFYCGLPAKLPCGVDPVVVSEFSCGFKILQSSSCGGVNRVAVNGITVVLQPAALWC